MKKLRNLRSVLLVVFVLLFMTCSKGINSEMHPTIYTGNLTISTQAEIDAFVYASVTGNLIINDSLDNSITNLDGLRNLIVVGGDFNISDTKRLNALEGLESLTTIDGDFSIQNNEMLMDFCAIRLLIVSGEITSSNYNVTENRYNPSHTEIQNSITCMRITEDLTLTTQAQIDGFPYIKVIGNLTVDESSDNLITSLEGLNSLLFWKEI